MKELPTYTSIFRIERRLYKVFDLELPRPVSLLQAGAFIGALIVLGVIGPRVGVPLTRNTGWLYVMVPSLAAYLATTPIADAKRPHEWVISRVRYWLEPRRLDRLCESGDPEVVNVRISAWRRRR